MATNDIEHAANYGRDKDRACRIEPDLPPTGQAQRRGGPTPAELDRTFGVDLPSPSAAEQRRRRDTWIK